MIRKFMFIALAFLFSIGIANAASIPESVDPKNAPEVWTESVYNGSGSIIYSGYIVSWDFDTSNPDGTWNDDMTNYVKTASRADDTWTAGVVPYGQNIADSSEGQIIIKGPAYVIYGSSATVNTLLGTTSTGTSVDYAAGTDDCALGRTIKSNFMGHGPDGGPKGWALVYVDVACSD